MDSAIEITSGWELERFDLGTININHTVYTVLTGYEGQGVCFWCGGELKGKLKRYCRGHMQEYYRHFEWSSASRWCLERYGYRCACCGRHRDNISDVGRYSLRTGLEVHHIVPLNGSTRYFSAFNLPWNLIALCHDCHLQVHAAMRPEKPPADPWEAKIKVGQIPLYPELLKL